jgi:hypothetical protein
LNAGSGDAGPIGVFDSAATTAAAVLRNLSGTPPGVLSFFPPLTFRRFDVDVKTSTSFIAMPTPAGAGSVS